VFVDDILVARPRDFGFLGQGEKAGRYAPWRNAANQERFKVDLKRMIDLALAGKGDQIAQANVATSSVPDQVTSLPGFKLTDRVVLVEFWATWCPPCGTTLQWLGTLKQRYGDKVAVLALAVESPEDKIKSAVQSIPGDIRWAVPDAKTAESFGDVAAVPTLLI